MRPPQNHDPTVASKVTGKPKGSQSKGPSSPKPWETHTVTSLTPSRHGQEVNASRDVTAATHCRKWFLWLSHHLDNFKV